MKELISVIVPVYNVEKYVLRCLESLNNQTFQNFEVIIVNDGSTDKSVDICRQFINQNELGGQFKILDKKNGGLSDARNYGVSFAQGKFIFFLDSDDYIEKDTFEIMISSIEKDTILVQTDYYIEYANGKKKVVVLPNYNSIDELSAYGDVVAWNKLYDRSFIQKNNMTFPKGLFYEDIYFFMELVSKIDSCSKLKTIHKTKNLNYN
jgi:glycosyltransferase involved in cell wall biosynthesis